MAVMQFPKRPPAGTRGSSIPRRWGAGREAVAVGAPLGLLPAAPIFIPMRPPDTMAQVAATFAR